MRAKKKENIAMGQRIKAAREKAHLTQAELSSMVGISPKTMSLVERGGSGMSVHTFCRLCAVLDVSSDSLLFGREPKNDVTRLSEKLAALEPAQFALVETILDHILLLADTPQNK